ncbi:hypothetical protein VNO77_02888 [Canavalia gladiata]|uniref:Uncharacterized protein n=1 Tax=Canavalia gladiata TaxID=3824 RepID=A0AAN9MUJ9_CANGL
MVAHGGGEEAYPLLERLGRETEPKRKLLSDFLEIWKFLHDRKHRRRSLFPLHHKREDSTSTGSIAKDSPSNDYRTSFWSYAFGPIGMLLRSSISHESMVSELQTSVESFKSTQCYPRYCTLSLNPVLHGAGDSVPEPQACKETPPGGTFNVQVVALSSCEEKEEQFKEQAANLRQRVYYPIASDFVFNAKEIWKTIVISSED